MPWMERSIMSQREEFVRLAGEGAESMTGLCRRFGISRQTGYLWCRRYRSQGRQGLVDRSRRPRRSPNRCGEVVEHAVLAVRARHPSWGGRKIRARLLALEHEAVPSASTITEILRRHGLITPEASAAATPHRRFEYGRPNELWQMDFKGPARTRRGDCHPLTILDDHSRYAIGLFACGDQKRQTVQERLTLAFRRYGLPWRILADNGPPWGRGLDPPCWTGLEIWLLKVGVLVIHGRPRHPQTQGKDERFHRTLGEEVLRRVDLRDRNHAQREFDAWRPVYNAERPHEALGLLPPASRYQRSERQLPGRIEALPPCGGDRPRRVTEGGRIRWGGRRWHLGNAWDQEVVGLREGKEDGVMQVHYGPYLIGVMDRREGGSRVRPVPVGRCAPSRHGPDAQ